MTTIQAIQAIQMDEEESETCEDGMEALQMEDINWEAGVTRIPYVGGIRPKCQTCHKGYDAFLEVHTHVTHRDTLNMVFVNLPCWHIDDHFGAEIAPDAKIRLLLVAEGEA